MSKIRRTAAAILIVIIFIAGFTPRMARADGNDFDDSKPLRLYSNAMAGPIGTINSRGLVTIDGRITRGDQPLWGGEMLYAPAGENVSLSFDSIGRVSVKGGSSVRFSASIASGEEGLRPVLVASLLAGSISVRLQRDAGAYVEAFGKQLTASPGASFRAEVRDNQVDFEAAVGTLEAQQQPQRRYILRPQGLGSNISVRARSTRQIQVRVTDEDGNPIPDLPIIFSLSNPCLGAFGLGLAAGAAFKEKTDNRGIVTVPFIAGAARCAGSLTATAEGTNSSLEFKVQVASPPGILSPQNLAIMGIASVAGGLIVYSVTSNDDNQREPIRPVPPPVVRP